MMSWEEMISTISKKSIRNVEYVPKSKIKQKNLELCSTVERMTAFILYVYCIIDKKSLLL